MSSENYIKELREMASKFDDDVVVVIAREVLNMPEFATWSACQNHPGHHFGGGGLAQHTFEVAELCQMNGYKSNAFGNTVINHKVLFLSALFHDIGKVWDYVYDKSYAHDEEGNYKGMIGWRGTPHKRKIHHITRSSIFWSKSVEKTGLCKDIEDDVLHCILSHHGRREWGSPVAPLSREAWLLHLCDCISARMNDCDRIDLININIKSP